MKIKLHLYYICWIIFIINSCKTTHNQNYISIAEQWQKKKISFPHNDQSNSIIYDSLNRKNPYKIIRYVDSTNCLICNLLLPRWETFYEQLPSVVPIHFFIHAKGNKELLHQIKLENTHINIHFDKNDSINILNTFPDDKKLQTFLVDSNNQIIIIGDPILNPALQKLYFEAIIP